MSIKIIGAGFPRTGTTTVKSCLEQLGYGKTYHMKELLVHPERLPYWLEMEEKRTTDWDALYEGYEATIDFPGYPYYKEHMERYPDAKVILTVRSFEQWYESVDSTIWRSGPQTLPEKLKMMWRMMTEPRIKKVVQCIKMFRRTFFDRELEGRFTDKAHMEKLFYQHIETVKQTVPAEKLLVYDVQEGWAPLCQFLGVPIREGALPHLNKRENFKLMLADLMQGNMV